MLYSSNMSHKISYFIKTNKGIKVVWKNCSKYLSLNQIIKIMKALIEKKIRFIDTNEDYIEVATTVSFLRIPVFWKSKKVVPPLDDSEMSQTKRLYKERITNSMFRG